MTTLIDLDDPRQAETLVATSYCGVKMAISRHRLHELLDREKELLSLLGGTPPGPRATPAEGVEVGEAPPRSVATTRRPETVTHGSLSSRIKKIHQYSLVAKRLRPAHIGLLRDLVQNFDWVFPEHATTALVDHLTEMLQWDDVPDDFRAEMTRFLKKYTKIRGLDSD